MPSIITDDMVKEMCKMSRPIPIQAIGVLDPNKKVGAKPNFIRKKGRTGIKPVELPIYAPANINGLVTSICNITKLEPEVVENYLDNAITQELGEYTGTQEDIEISFDADQMLWDRRSIMIIFEDGSSIIPMSDDEGNNGGALHYYEGNGGKTETIGVLWND